ncbi:MAG: hypothetical protein FD143_2989 [Ignavibacteria bacterium]|nr:MAG: hypothetical protein FD143_2989 [Ignavibacteria bacterium]KAF0156553.1 MAG: hypothetical protein FD188_2947 [Ignavibacteria bacterium]
MVYNGTIFPKYIKLHYRIIFSENMRNLLRTISKNLYSIVVAIIVVSLTILNVNLRLQNTELQQDKSLIKEEYAIDSLLGYKLNV